MKLLDDFTACKIKCTSVDIFHMFLLGAELILQLLYYFSLAISNWTVQKETQKKG